MSSFRILPEAAADLEEIYDSVAEDSPEAARALCEEIYHALGSQLGKFPNAGHARPDLSASLLFWTVRRRLIAYLRDPVILVVAVLDGRRDPVTLAAILESRR